MPVQDSRWLPPAYLLVLAIYPVLYIAASNSGQVDARSIVMVASAAAIASIAIWAATCAAAATTRSAAVAAAFLVFAFFIYGAIGRLLDDLIIWLQLGDNETPNALDLWPKARMTAAILWGLVSLIVAVAIARAKWADSLELARAANVTALVLVLTLVVPYIAAAVGSHGLQNQPSAKAIDGPTLRAGGSRPDIYFIVLDGYARSDVLRKHYGFDNQAFIDALLKRGFRVPAEFSSNYSWTFLSLASTLNMVYVHDLLQSEEIAPTNVDRSVLYERLRDSKVSRFLRSRGYEIVHVRSTWGATSSNPRADREIRCESGVYTNEFVRAVVEASWWGAFHSKAGVDLARCNLSNFRALSEMRPTARPKFVFAHFILPHHPYLFDRVGGVRKNVIVSNQFEFQSRLWEDRVSYRDQLEFVNDKVLQVVTELTGDPKRIPIIVIASDHGPSLRDGLADADRKAIRFASFGAYLLPGAPDNLLPDGLTAVNQFRLILGHYFASDLTALRDRHFSSTFALPYDFREMPHDFLVDLWTRMNAQPQAEDIPTPGALGVEQSDE
jgi:hypothetical protein